MEIRCFAVEKTGNTRVELKTYYCEQCKEDHTDQTNYIEWKRLDTGEVFEVTSEYNLPVGAMYIEETWDIHTDENNVETARYKGNGHWNNDDGMHLYVMVPTSYTFPDGTKVGGVHRWDVDTRASNCDMKQDRMHRCWVRHGTIPNITVDKAGHTCGAGAGSILVDGWHGFLQNGVLREC